ncbi:MAG: sigma-70 family RNA polymerase sigma factor [Geothermobacteraceae bacterium]
MPSQPNNTLPNASSQDTAESPLRWLEEHGDVLYRMALVRVGKPDLAEDLVQDTLIAAWQARESFAGRSSARTWLVAILKRKVIDHFRRSWRHVDLPGELTIDDLSDDFITRGENAEQWKPERAPSEWGDTPEALLHNRQLGSALRQCLAQLPESLAAIFAVREIDGLTTEEICQEFSLSPSNLWTMLHRARARLRRCLEKTGFSPRA